MKYPKSFQELIESFMLYPGVGPKSAERMAYHTILKLNKEQALKFSQTIMKAYDSITKCQNCGNLSETSVCDICEDYLRENVLMIVESSRDVNVFEKTNKFRGKYHVLNGLISPMHGISYKDINLSTLENRIKNEKIEKIIIATSATINGEATSMYIKNILSDVDVDIYRIGYGLPVGADIEYADSITLSKALEGIKKI